MGRARHVGPLIMGSVRLKRVEIGPERYMDVDLKDGAGQRICDLDELNVPGRDLRFCASKMGREIGIILEFQSPAARGRNSALIRSFDGHEERDSRRVVCPARPRMLPQARSKVASLPEPIPLTVAEEVELRVRPVPYPEPAAIAARREDAPGAVASKPRCRLRSGTPVRASCFVGLSALGMAPLPRGRGVAGRMADGRRGPASCGPPVRTEGHDYAVHAPSNL